MLARLHLLGSDLLSILNFGHFVVCLAETAVKQLGILFTGSLYLLHPGTAIRPL